VAVSSNAEYHTHTRTHTHTNTHTYRHRHTHIHTHTYKHTHVHVHAYTHIPIHMLAHTHTHTHKYTQSTMVGRMWPCRVMLRILLPDTDNKCFAISSCERKRVTETAQGGGVSDKDLIIAQHKTVLTYTYIHKYTQK